MKDSNYKGSPSKTLRSYRGSPFGSPNTVFRTDEVEWLAKEYIRYDAVPKNYPEDAYHIAIAVISEVDYLLSWNFKHIVRKKTRDVVRMVNSLNNFREIEIMTPAEVL